MSSMSSPTFIGTMIVIAKMMMQVTTRPSPVCALTSPFKNGEVVDQAWQARHSLIPNSLTHVAHGRARDDDVVHRGPEVSHVLLLLEDLEQARRHEHGGSVADRGGTCTPPC